MAEPTSTLSTGIDYFMQAQQSLQEKYVSGFWSWLEANKPNQYEIIQMMQERIHDTYTSGADELYRYEVQRWWNRVRTNLNEYRKDEEAQKEYRRTL